MLRSGVASDDQILELRGHYISLNTELKVVVPSKRHCLFLLSLKYDQSKSTMLIHKKDMLRKNNEERLRKKSEKILPNCEEKSLQRTSQHAGFPFFVSALLQLTIDCCL